MDAPPDSNEVTNPLGGGLGTATVLRVFLRKELLMIVMKFGGTSLGSATSLAQVLPIIRSEIHRHPVIVASAMGDTTDLLLEMVAEARKANTYAVLKLLEVVREHHFAICETLLHDYHRESAESYLRNTFRDLHVRALELCEGERVFNPELQDWIVSLGEQLSSRILAEILDEHVGPTVHVDARKLIVTNQNFTDAEPRYWETYARIRWTVPVEARDKLVVLGGFIGSTENGSTTTLGRGGSDLTASIIGAAINADEIHVWKDVDGMLTCDPRLLPGGRQVKYLSYAEATELAQAGATILHPKTIEPAKRLRIPIVIRNTFHPECQGTRIELTSSGSGIRAIKSIAIRKHITLLEISSANGSGNSEAVIAACSRFSSAASLLHVSDDTVYVAVDEQSKMPEEDLACGGCVAVHVRSQQAILTLVGQCGDKQAASRKVMSALEGTPAVLIPSESSTCSIRLSVPQILLKRCLELLHAALFANADPRLFGVAASSPRVEVEIPQTVPADRNLSTLKPFVPTTAFLQFN